MVLQLNEKYLSDKARKAVRNIDNKSQLLREAVEFYVNRDEILAYGNSSKEKLIISLIEEIKDLNATIKNMKVQNVEKISNSTNEDIKDTDIIINNNIESNHENENIGNSSITESNHNEDLSCYED